MYGLRLGLAELRPDHAIFADVLDRHQRRSGRTESDGELEDLWMDLTTPLLTDLYQLNMMQAYLETGRMQTAVFEFFVRRLPERRGFLMAAGLEQVVGFLEGVRFSPEELAWLKTTSRFSDAFIGWLASLRFNGDVDAMPEGTLFFQDEPIVRVVAPLPVAQLVETRVINILHYQTLAASKAARMVLAAPGKLMVDFGLRRAHGAEAGLMAARASYIAGFAGTATTLAGMRWGVPLFGTMAHSFIQSFDDEMEAFEAFARARPKNLVLLIDTYDTEEAARKVVELAPRLQQAGVRISGVRLDSGDLIKLSRSVRRILDEGGLKDTTIFASGGLDEEDLIAFAKAKAPIDGYGMGTSLTTSSDVPALDCAYKLEEYAGLPRRKRSQGKATWPGRKQVWRRYGPDGLIAGDVISTEHDRQEGAPLLHAVMRGGERIHPLPELAAIRAHAAEELLRLPEPLRQLEPHAYPVEIAPSLRKLAEDVDRRMAHQEATA